MRYQVTITEQAKADIREILAYIANDCLQPDAAARQLDRLEAEISGLQTMPDRFRRYQKEPWYSRGLRVMPVDRYLVFYLSDHEQKTVHVIRVMYCGRDLDAQLEMYI